MKTNLLVFFLVLSFFANSQPYIFEHYNIEEGLSQSGVNHLMRDSHGFLWVSTQDGLNRFDGYGFKTFRNSPYNLNSIPDNFIWSCLEDSEGAIWVGAFHAGLIKYDVTTEKFQHIEEVEDIPDLKFNALRDFLEYPKGTVWLANNNGDLISYDIPTKKYTLHFSHALDSKRFPFKNLVGLEAIEEKQLLLTTDQGLWVYDVKKQVATPLKIKEKTHEIQTTAYYKNQKGDFWIGAEGGLIYGRIEGDNFHITKRWMATEYSSVPMLESTIKAIYEDQFGKVWFGTTEGLCILNPKDASFIQYPFGTPAIPNFHHGQINCIYGDANNIVWIGTKEGVYKVVNRGNPFKTIRPENGLCNPHVLGINQDKAGNLWAGTRGGLAKITGWAEEKVEVACFGVSQQVGLESDYILNVTKDKTGELWVCTRRGGFNQLNQEGAKVLFQPHYQTFEQKEGTLDAAVIYTVFQDNQNKLYAGTAFHGLNEFHPDGQLLQTYRSDEQDNTALPHNWVYNLVQNSEGQIWVGTAGGHALFNKDKGNFTPYTTETDNAKSISNNTVLCQYIDTKGRHWVGTANGLNLLGKSGVYQRFYIEDGLPNNVIYGILEDDEGYLWVSTNFGIARLQYKDDRLIVHTFDKSDGLPSLEYNQFSFFKATDGTLFFGGVNGLLYFQPSEVKLNQNPPKTILTDIKLFNKSLAIGSDKKQQDLTQTPMLLQTLTLPYHQNFLSFTFAAMDFTASAKNQYAYQLEGVDQDWVYSGNRRFADYPNLSPGTYTFKVKAANNDGLWNEIPTNLKLKIRPPFWATNIAYGLYILAFVGIIWGIIKFRENTVRRLEQAKMEERERFRKRSSQDFHDEAGNKITKIALVTELAKRQSLDPTLQHYLRTIEDNIQQLNTGMRDFIWTLDPTKDNLYDTFVRLKDFGDGMFQFTDIHFKTKGITEILKKDNINMTSRRHLLLIFKEAMNNCIKYADCKTVTFDVARSNGHLVASLKDDGKGFNLQQGGTGNGLKNMTERGKKMGGVLNIISEKDSGTNICLKIDIESVV